MKYSVIMPYYKRDSHLHNTLLSYRFYYKDRNDYEIIIIEDVKNRLDKDEHDKLLKVINNYSDINIRLILSGFENCYNPSPMFNLGVKHSSGEFLVITNPEGFHKVNILSGLDQLFNQDKNIHQSFAI